MVHKERNPFFPLVRTRCVSFGPITPASPEISWSQGRLGRPFFLDDDMYKTVLFKASER